MMRKSLKNIWSAIGDLIQQHRLSFTDVLHIDVTFYNDPEIVLCFEKALELARAFRVARSKVNVRRGTESVQITFKAQGINWRTVILNEHAGDFLRHVGVDPVPLLEKKTGHAPRLNQRHLALPNHSASAASE